MVQDNLNPIEFLVISNDDKVILEAVREYNNNNNTDFKVIDFLYDEVVFAKLRVTCYKISDIFDLGYYFHSTITFKRQKGEIDW